MGTFARKRRGSDLGTGYLSPSAVDGHATGWVVGVEIALAPASVVCAQPTLARSRAGSDRLDYAHQGGDELGQRHPSEHAVAARPDRSADRAQSGHAEAGALLGAAAERGRRPAVGGRTATGTDPSWWESKPLSAEALAMPEPHSADSLAGDRRPAERGEGVRCPSCGRTDALRIRRRLLDRLLSWVHAVYRFRCADPHCGWEGTLPQKSFARDWRRRHYRY